MVIPCGTTTCKQLSRLDTDPAALLHPASDVCLRPPAGFATGLVASRCPGEDLHLLDSINRFHRGCHPRIPTVTSLARHDSALLGPYTAAQPSNGKELGHRPRYTLHVAVGRVRPSTPVVPCARLLGWSREPAAPSVVTGCVLIPFGRVLHSRRSRARCAAPPPTIVEMTMAPRKQKQARSKSLSGNKTFIKQCFGSYAW